MKTNILITLLVSLITFSSKADTNFVLIADTGQDNEGQLSVSQSLQEVCQIEKCGFGVLAGDNVYPDGVTSATDPILTKVFDKYYNKLNIPFVVALGNHDYGGRLPTWENGDFQLLHAKKNKLFHLPNFYYTYSTENVVFAVIDTTKLVWRIDEEKQAQVVAAGLKEATTSGKWFMVVGHHPYLSNGDHGNAGNFDGFSFPSQVSGSHFKKFMDKHVCGKAQFYLSGHDHNLQMIDGKIAQCNTQLIVSGSGASNDKLSNRNKVLFQSENLGFFHLSVSASEVKVKAWNEKVKTIFERTFRK